MTKIIVHFIVLAALFLGVWFLLGNIDYLKHFRVDELTKEAERNLGNLILDELQKGGGELHSDTVYRSSTASKTGSVRQTASTIPQ